MSSKKEIMEFEIKGRKLTCPICGSTRFWTRKSLLNTRGLTFMELDWANKQAINYICDGCDYIVWFFEE